MAKETPLKPKPPGYLPIERTGVNVRGLGSAHYHGDPAYMIAKPDFEALRRQEKTVGDDGVREVRMTKMGPLADDLALQQYRNDGYEIKDGAHEWILRLPQSEFEALERARHQAARRLADAAKKDSGQGLVRTEAFVEDEGEVSSKDI